MPDSNIFRVYIARAILSKIYRHIPNFFSSFKNKTYIVITLTVSAKTVSFTVSARTIHRFPILGYRIIPPWIIAPQGRVPIRTNVPR